MAEKPSKCTQRRKILPEFEHVDHVEVNDIKNFHGLIITHRAEKCSLRTDGNTLDHTYMPETNRLIIYKSYSYILSERKPHYHSARLVAEKWLVWCCSLVLDGSLSVCSPDVLTGHLPKWLRKCLTNSTPSSSFFFQNFTCPS